MNTPKTCIIGLRQQLRRQRKLHKIVDQQMEDVAMELERLDSYRNLLLKKIHVLRKKTELFNLVNSIISAEEKLDDLEKIEVELQEMIDEADHRRYELMKKYRPNRVHDAETMLWMLNDVLNKLGFDSQTYDQANIFPHQNALLVEGKAPYMGRFSVIVFESKK